MNAIAIGPLVLSLPRVFFIVGLIAVFLVARRIERRTDASLDGALWMILLAGLLGARAVYVLTRLPHFRAAPLEALALWQDGYTPWAGLIAAAATAVAIAWRRALPATYLAAPLAAGLLVWGGLTVAGTLLLRAGQQSLPELTLTRLDGGQTALTSLRGRPVVLNLWATWCPPCRREMPVLAAAQRAIPDVEFLFVNQGEDAATIEAYLAREGLSLRNVVLDPATQASGAFRAPGMPTTLFFDADGRLRDQHMGELSSARLADYLEGLR